MKNTILICGLAFSVLIVIVLWWFIWINRGSDSIIWQFVRTVLVALVLACGLLFYEFFRTDPLIREESFTFVIPFTDDGRIIDLSRMSLPPVDRSVTEAVNSWLKSKGPKIPVEKPPAVPSFFLDLAQTAALIWLQRSAENHWGVERSQFVGVFAGGMGQVKQKPNAEKNPLKLSVSDIASRLPENELYRTYASERQESAGSAPSIALVLPSCSAVSFPKNPTTRAIVIENRHMALGIACTLLFGENDGPETVTVKHIREKLRTSAIHSQVMQVQLSYETKRRLRWSEATMKQEAWANDLINRFKQDFDWAVIRKAIERDYDEKKPKLE